MGMERVERTQQAGVNAKEVVAFLHDLEKMGASNHGVIVIRGGKIAVETYQAPYGRQYVHSMYSSSKSVAGTAIGFLISEGKLSLEDNVQQLFPENKRIQKDPRYKAVTVHSLLCMHSGKLSNMAKDMSKANGVDVFVKYKWQKENTFLYSNDDIYMLSEIVFRKTGQQMSEYLYPRLFQPLGIPKPYWEATQAGVELGFAGIYLTMYDMARIIKCYMDGGIFEGKQVIPAEWVKLATAKQSDVDNEVTEEQTIGYGYTLWLDEFGGFRSDGLYGQLSIAFPQYDAVVGITNASCNDKLTASTVWKHFPLAFQTEDDGSGQVELDALIEQRGKLELPVRRSTTEKEIEGAVFRISKKTILNKVGFPTSILPFTLICSMAVRSGGFFTNLKLSFTGDGCKLSWSETVENNTINVGMNGEYSFSSAVLGGITYDMLATGYWVDDKHLRITVKPITTMSTRIMNIYVLSPDKIKLKMDSIPSTSQFFLGQIGSKTVPTGSKVADAIVSWCSDKFCAAAAKFAAKDTLKGKRIRK